MLVGWGNVPIEPGFGGSRDDASVKAKMINLISSVRTLMRSKLFSDYASMRSWGYKGADESMQKVRTRLI